MCESITGEIYQLVGYLFFFFFFFFVAFFFQLFCMSLANSDQRSLLLIMRKHAMKISTKIERRQKRTMRESIITVKPISLV